MSLSAEIVSRAEALDVLPGPVARVAALHLLDALGVGIAAVRTTVGRPWQVRGRAMVRPDGVATIIGQHGAGAAADAGLVNGALIHSLEYDDTHTGSIVHGSAVLAATALACVEAQAAAGRDIRGLALLRAYAVWYEVLIRIGLAASGGFQARGFQVTSVGGSLCAAGLAAEVQRLDQAGRVAAVGIALSQASGGFEFLSNGSTVKSMHPGWAAHSGIIAAELAAAGLTGPETALEGRYGLFRLFAADGAAAERLRAEVADLGERWQLLDAAYKFAPCCHYLHPFLEAARLIAERGVTPDQILSVSLEVPAGAAPVICEPWAEKCAASGHSARWSLPVVVAMQFVEGSVGLESFERGPPAAVRSLAERCSWSELENSAFPNRFEAGMRVATSNGTVHAVRVDDVYGNVTRPAKNEEITAKFRRNLRYAGSEEAADALIGCLDHLGQDGSIRELSRAIQAAAPKEHLP